MEIPNTLFSETKRKELCTGKKILPKQKTPVKKWKERLDADELKIETQNKGHFRDLMIDALGYPREKIREEVNRLDFSCIPPSGSGGVLFELKSRKKKLFEFQGYDKKEQDTPITQAITYIEKNPEIDYAVVTNFEEFVLITRESMRAECYKFTFPPKKMKLLEQEIIEFISIFSKDSIDSRFIKTLKHETEVEEEDLTDDFYKLYHQTRLMLIHAFQDKSNVDNDDAIKFAQTYLNRLIFLFFAEDNNLVKKDIFSDGILALLNSGDVKEKTTKISDYIQTIFSWMDTGSNEIDNKSGFNGEFFKEPMDRNAFFYDFKEKSFFDKITEKVPVPERVKLNKIRQNAVDRYNGKISPIIINLLKMDSYDFNDEPDDSKDQDTDEYHEKISVNILGHIFEQSIGDLEELQNKKKSQRKKEGVFYTPEYVTEYICKNTIIPYLSKKGVTEPHQLILEYKDNIQELEDKFQKIKILDPACGSGAFLVKSVDILLSIHDEIQKFKQKGGSYIHATKGKRSGTQKWMTFDKESEKVFARGIIKDNIYGVDINSESVEITKLSLFLKIASKGRQLIGLSARIQHGNSLTDKNDDGTGFDWNAEFPEILSEKLRDEPGFDIVVTNPPYAKEMDNKDTFEPVINADLGDYHQGKMDYWYFFVHRAIEVLKDGGRFGLITNSYWYKSSGSKKMIQRIKDNLILEKCVDFGKIKVFKDVSDKHMIHLYRKNKTQANDKTTYIKLDKKEFKKVILEKNKIIKPYSKLFTPDLSLDFFPDEIDFKNCSDLGDVYNSSTGVQESTDKVDQNALDEIGSKEFQVGDGIFVLSESEMKSLNFSNQEQEVLKKYLVSTAVGKYSISFKNEYLIYSDEGVREKISDGEYPNIQKHLDNLSPFITSVNHPYGLHRPRPDHFFLNPKLICKGMFSSPEFYYDEEQYFVGFSFSVISKKDSNFDLKYLLGLLNSNMARYWFNRYGKHRGVGVDIGVTKFRLFPVFNADENQQKQIISLVEKLLKNYKSKIEEEQNFWNRVFHKFNISSISTDFKNFYTIQFNEFLSELEKISQSTLTPTEQEDWEQYFKTKTDSITKIDKVISKDDHELNDLIYKLYQFSDSEISILDKIPE